LSVFLLAAIANVGLGMLQLKLFEATTEAKLASYERGRDVARRAIDLAPRSPEAHLWYAANLGRWAITSGRLRAAFSYLKTFEEVGTKEEIANANHPRLRHLKIPHRPSDKPETDVTFALESVSAVPNGPSSIPY
jgi:Flp pilus assembly protein TadD